MTDVSPKRSKIGSGGSLEVNYDEKPGIQAIANTSDDLRPKKGNGEAIPLVSSTHKSSDFIEFLKILDKKYPAQDTIRIILDNHSAHKSKQTRRFLETMPDGRFEFVFTPKHGSCLNMIESFFSKMLRAS